MLCTNEILFSDIYYSDILCEKLLLFLDLKKTKAELNVRFIIQQVKRKDITYMLESLIL